MVYVATKRITLFISHSTKNKAELDTLRNAIDGKIFGNYTLKAIIIDPENTLLGASIPEAIKNGIDESDLFIVLITEESRNSIWVNQEIGYAVKKFTRSTEIIPLVEFGQDKEKGFITDEYVCAHFPKGDITPAIERLKRDLVRRFGELGVPVEGSTAMADIVAEGFKHAFFTYKSNAQNESQ